MGGTVTGSVQVWISNTIYFVTTEFVLTYLPILPIHEIYEKVRPQTDSIPKKNIRTPPPNPAIYYPK
jgi:hypothetical protein